MSSYVQARWDLRSEQERRVYLEVLADRSRLYHQQYTSALEQLRQLGADQILPREFARLQGEVTRLGQLIESDPEAARDLNQLLTPEVAQFQTLARSVVAEYRQRERQRQLQEQEERQRAAVELQAFLASLQARIDDPIVREFALEPLQALRVTYADRLPRAAELSDLRREIRDHLTAILERAGEQSAQWKERQRQEQATAACQRQVELHQACLRQEAELAPEACQSESARWQAIQEVLASGQADAAQLHRDLAEERTRSEKAIVQERCRRQAVRAILASLQTAGFLVEAPRRQTGDKDEVVIRARKPAGAEASFRVGATGEMLYKFDRYEGSACQTDLARVLPLLRDVYGVNLSDERVLWRNPDRLSCDARPLPSTLNTPHYEHRHS